MSAGSLPKLTKTEPWELIQAFAEAQNQAAAQANQIHAQQAMEAMREAGADRRMERAHALGIDKLKQELAIKSPYEIAAEQRQQQNALGLIGAKGEEGRKDITLQGEVNQQTHRSNKQFDVDADVDYKRRELEVTEPYKERSDQRTLERQKELDAYRTDQNVRQQKELEPLQVERERRQDERTQTAEERRAELEYKYRQRGATEDQARRLAEQDAALGRQKEMTRFSTDEAIRREKELEDTRIAREKAKQDAIGGRQRSALDLRGDKALELQRQKDEAALQRSNLSNEAKAEQIRLREQLRKIAPRFAVPTGYILHDPEKFIEEDRLKLNDPNQYEKLGVYQDPTRPGKNYEVYRPKNPNMAVQPPGSAAPTTRDAAPPAARQAPVPPNADTGVPSGRVTNPFSGRGELDRPPASTTPAPPATSGTTPTPPPDTDWLRRSPETERPPSTGKGDRRGELEGARAQYASLGGDDDLSQFRDQPGVTAAPKDSYRSIDRAQQPVTTSGRPENRGTFLKTADEAPGPLRDKLIKYASRHGLNPDVLAAVTWQESKWKPNALSRANAAGIAQFIPDTARRFGIDPYNVDQSLDASAKYIQQNRRMFNGNLGLALAGYNMGEGSFRKGNGVAGWLQRGADPARMPRETRNYVQAITGKPIEFWVAKYNGGSGRMQDTGRLQEDTGGPQYRSSAAPAPAPQRYGSEVPLPPRRPQMDEAPTRAPSYNLMPDDPPAERVQAFIVHHTARGDLDQRGTQELMAKRKVGANYFMERDGSITQLVPDSQVVNQIRSGLGPNRSLNNGNVLGIEVRANDDKDVTPAQVESFKRFYGQMLRKYPNLRLFSHGEIDSPHKQETEGKTLADAVRRGARQPRRGEEIPTPPRRPKISRTDHPDLFYVDV